MKTLDLHEGDQWLKSHGWNGVSSKQLQSGMPVRRRYSLPPDTGKKTALARNLSEYFSAFSHDRLLWISDDSIWPSSENPALFDAYRSSFGESRTLSETPYHLLSCSDRVHLECLMDIVFYFFWDAVLLDSQGSYALQVSHDEWFDIYSSDEFPTQGIDYQKLDFLNEIEVSK